MPASKMNFPPGRLSAQIWLNLSRGLQNDAIGRYSPMKRDLTRPFR
jgi:hypothetical protein